MFRKRIGIDLGTANTVFVAEGNSVVLDQPSVVAIQRLNGKTKVVAVGEPARLMLGKTPKSIEASTPLRDGVIANFEVAERMWTAPIEWSGLNVSAWWASGPSGRWFPALGDGIPRRCGA